MINRAGTKNETPLSLYVSLFLSRVISVSEIPSFLSPISFFFLRDHPHVRKFVERG